MGVDIITVFNPREQIDYNPTNGDKIREMVDSELAKIIMCPYDAGQDQCNEKGCYDCCLDWLQQPVE